MWICSMCILCAFTELIVGNMQIGKLHEKIGKAQSNRLSLPFPPNQIQIQWSKAFKIVFFFLCFFLCIFLRISVTAKKSWDIEWTLVVMKVATSFQLQMIQLIFEKPTKNMEQIFMSENEWKKKPKSQAANMICVKATCWLQCVLHAPLWLHWLPFLDVYVIFFTETSQHYAWEWVSSVLAKQISVYASKHHVNQNRQMAKEKISHSLATNKTIILPQSHAAICARS